MRMSLSSRLRAREQELGRPVRIGLAGAGQMGMGFVAQVQRIPGMTTAAIADVLPGRPKDAFAQAGVNGVVEGDDPGTLSQAVADGRPVGVADARLLVDLPVDMIVGKPEQAMYEAARDRLGEGRILALGDRLDADVLGAKRAGFDSALVLTGATERGQVDGAKPAPTHVADSLAALLLTS